MNTQDTSNQADAIALLKRWHSLFMRIEAAYADLRKTLGAAPESEVVTLMNDLHAQYTSLLAEKLGDDSNWLEWYLLENGGGKKEFIAKAASWETHRKIKTLDDLWALISADKGENV